MRGATASGVTVVAAAGNRGVAADGRLVYGSIASPGHDPSVITVGAVNLKGTEVRSDDVVTRFSLESIDGCPQQDASDSPAAAATGMSWPARRSAARCGYARWFREHFSGGTRLG